MGHEVFHYVDKEIQILPALISREVTRIGVFEIGQKPILLWVLNEQLSNLQQQQHHLAFKRQCFWVLSKRKTNIKNWARCLFELINLSLIFIKSKTFIDLDLKQTYLSKLKQLPEIVFVQCELLLWVLLDVLLVELVGFLPDDLQPALYLS